MEFSDFYIAYFNRDITKLNQIPGIHKEIKDALVLHWDGDLNSALDILEAFKNILPTGSALNEFVSVEIQLLYAKLGNSEGFYKNSPLKLISNECKYISAYASFSMAFWINHKVAWRCLWKLLGLSINIPIKGSTSMVIFLMCHLSAISGKRIGFFRQASDIYNYTILRAQSQNNVPNFFQNIVIAAYPYTIFVSNKISEDLSAVLANGEKLLPNDPYYRSLFCVSGLYCYAYSGDVTRTELYVARLTDAQSKGNLLRYRPVSKIMKFLPFALRGYGFLIIDDFKYTMLTGLSSNDHPLITSQFYRAASIIYLSLGEFDNAEKNILMAISERRKTNSFFAWNNFDLHILKLSQTKKPFNPQVDPILTHKLQFENNTQFMRFLIDMLSLVSSSVNVKEEEFYSEIRNRIISHLDHKDIEIVNEIDDSIMTNPVIKFGQKYFVLINSPKERESFFRSLLNSMGPISVILMNSFNSQKKAQEFEKVKSFAEIANQVSHDIRSPLSALNMLLSQMTTLPETQRIMVRTSVNRINDIANNLLNHGKNKQNIEKPAHDEIAMKPSSLSNTLLAALIDPIVSEKRMQYREFSNLQIEARLENSYGLFAMINPTELARTLSNAINNAVEAFGNNGGLVEIILETKDLYLKKNQDPLNWKIEKQNPEEIVLIVRDNGKGIPESILAKLGAPGITHGKNGTQSGSGLGVYHAKKTIESFGGKYEILSSLNKGTSVVMTLKKADPPEWFVPALQLRPGQIIVGTDDDSSILEIWKQRFSDLVVAKEVELHTCTSGTCLKTWFIENKHHIDNTLFLMDYELLNQKQTGLDLIEELGIGSRAILVSSRYEELPIRKRCADLGVRLIPKGMAPLVPIVSVAPKAKFKLSLIDDDDLVRQFWSFAAKERGHSIALFSNPDEFFLAAKNIDPITPVFIDSNLGNGIKGQVIAEQVAKLGFGEIHIATGYEANSIMKPDCCCTVVGKDYPFY